MNYISKESIVLFSFAVLVLFCKARRPGGYLVSAKLQLLGGLVGSFKCNGTSCQVYSNVTETKTFPSTITNKEYKIKHELKCNDKCITYLLTYNKYILP